MNNIYKLLRQKNAVLIAHYYVDSKLQELAEETSGFIGDSLEMARFGKKTKADIIVVAGVRFMGETAKILSPHKKVLVLDTNATCSLDEGCNIDEFTNFCNKYKDREIVVYANTSARVKALADWTVTSSSAVNIVDYLKKQNKKIIWAPDKHLGRYIKNKTKADMVLWDGACVVHEKFKAEGISLLKSKYPQAKVLVHPESPQEVVDMADVVGSTTQLIQAVKTLNAKEFIIATDNGIFHKMRQVNPNAKLIEAPSMGEGADCESCAHCEWMALNNTTKLYQSLKHETGEIVLDAAIISKAQRSINKLLEFTEKAAQ